MNIERFKAGNWGKIVGFFDIRTGDGFLIKGFKLIDGSKGMFVGFPSQKGSDGKYYDTVFGTDELKSEMIHLAKEAYARRDGAEAEQPGPATSSGEFLPPPGSSFPKDDIPF